MYDVVINIGGKCAKITLGNRNGIVYDFGKLVDNMWTLIDFQGRCDVLY